MPVSRLQIGCCILALFMFSALVVSQDSGDSAPFIAPQEEPSLPVPPSSNPLSSLISWVVALLLVIAVIYVLAFFFKKGLMRVRQPLGPQGSFRLIGHLTLSPKLMLYLVEVADRVLVMAVTDDSATTLSEITDPEVVDRLGQEATIYEPQTPDFISYFKQAADRLKQTKRA